MNTREAITFFLNGKPMQVRGAAAFRTVARFFREDLRATGTKIVCEEGDCGACTLLVANSRDEQGFRAVNSCILPVYALDGCSVVTVEGLKQGDELHPVQEAMVTHFGSQCGFCTPGMVCAMAALAEDSALKKKAIDDKRARNFLTGNLCRCTGYEPILKAACSVNVSAVETLAARYNWKQQQQELLQKISAPLALEAVEKKFFAPSTLGEALVLKAKHPGLILMGGSTDLGVLENKGRWSAAGVLSLQNISELYDLKRGKDAIYVGARATLARIENFFETEVSEFGDMLHVFASPQIKNSATLVGNVVNASPIADTIPYLLVAGAAVVIGSVRGERVVPLENFYLGYKKLDLAADEIVTHIRLPFPKKSEFVKLYKVSTREDLDISTVTLAMAFETPNGVVHNARIAFGGVGPTVLRMKAWEKTWDGKKWDRTLLEAAISELPKLISPISDLRGSREYRLKLCENLLKRAWREYQEAGNV